MTLKDWPASETPSQTETVMPSAAADPVWDTWASVPWTAVDLPESTSPAGRRPNILGWLKAGVPYLPRGEALFLQTLDIWIPSFATGTGAAPDISSLPGGPPGSVWIIYIHGGAWRDPRITSASFTPAATNLLLRALASENSSSSSSPSYRTKLAGLVSLNYRLSPHPSHPSADPARKAKHPDHISDILTALSFLSRLGLIPTRGANNSNSNSNNNSTKWILAGHSCGATLSFQTLMPHFLLSPPPAVLPSNSSSRPPSAVVGFNGLYDLAGFIAHPPESHAHLREGYREFTVSAFGEDERVWRAVCPASCEPGWVSKGWVGRRQQEEEEEEEEEEGMEDGAKIVAVLVQSREDQLVPWQQLERMRDCLEREGPAVEEVRVTEARGEHDEIWREGERMAEVLWEVVEGL